jgi:hypothetical protein
VRNLSSYPAKLQGTYTDLDAVIPMNPQQTPETALHAQADIADEDTPFIRGLTGVDAARIVTSTHKTPGLSISAVRTRRATLARGKKTAVTRS